MTTKLPPLTEFQKAILWAAGREPNRIASLWVIAQTAFTEKWMNRASRGALVRNIRKAAEAMPDMCIVSPPKSEHDDYTVCVRSGV